jgi:hypothetical protein
MNPMSPPGTSPAAPLLVIRVDHQHGVETGRRKLRVGRLASNRAHVAQTFPIQPALDRLEHLRLNVLGIDEAVRADTPGQAHREPSAAGAEICDH